MRGAFGKQRIGHRFRHFSEPLALEISRLAFGMSVADYGAGLGLYVHYLRRQGHQAVGYDGTAGVEVATGGLVQHADLAAEQELHATGCGMSIEVGEHIPPQFTDTFVDNITRHTTRLIVISWAVAGQRGRGHVNCLDPVDVIRLFHLREWHVQFQSIDSRWRVGVPFDNKLLLFRPQPDPKFGQFDFEKVFSSSKRK